MIERSIPDLDAVRPPRPDLDAAEREADAAVRALAEAADPDAALAAVLGWEATRRRLWTWQTLASVRFRQDVRDGRARADHDEANARAPRVKELDQRVQAALLDGPWREELERRLGRQPFDLWRAERDSFDPRVADLVAEEERLKSRYTALVGSARVPFRGEERTLAQLAAALADPDRATRAEANTARWTWFAEHAEELDTIFDALVRVRDRIARELGAPNFVPVGYGRMRRVDYGREDVARFRDAVRRHVTPLAERLAEDQARALGVDRLMHWDEKALDAEGAPAPKGGRAWMEERAQEMFDGVDARHGTGLGELFSTLRARGYLDLEARDGKGAGGFCAMVQDVGAPVVFANFNGTSHDARVFTHEMGHAYQGWRSLRHPLLEGRRCTSESAEVHSMSLELLTWPEMERFFGEDADRFRQQHLAERLSFLPYGCAVDHFQHQVYARPDASPAERHAIWRELERAYVPWRDHGDVVHASTGGFWQQQLHLYLHPFYYVDYVLAGVVSLQVWALARRDEAEAWRRYEELCATGGSVPFRELVRSAGLDDPFEEGVLERVVGEASAWLARA